MSNTADAIMDAAERRIRIGGFNGFSFRDIAAETGIKSSSVHYHFPTKENLVAAIIHRYTEREIKIIDAKVATGANAIKVWTRAFRNTLHSQEHMCPCLVLAVTNRDLPAKVVAEYQLFFKTCIQRLMASGLTQKRASHVLSTITGAMVVANAINDLSAYDRATADLMREPDAGTT